MSKFDRVLSDGDIDSFFTSFQERSFSDWVAMGRALAKELEQAVLAKLAEQTPVAWASSRIVGHYIPHDIKVTAAEWFKDGLDVPLYAHPMPCVSSMQGKAACAPESRESDTQTNSQVNLDSSSHIPNSSKVVAEMYWINPDYPSSDSIIEAFEPITSSVEVDVGDRYEVSRAIRLPDMVVEVTELEENGDVKSYKIVGGDHITEPVLD